MRPDGWDVAIGETDSRTSLQARFGGSLSRGISAPKAGSDRHDIMLWWRPKGGEAFGYNDGWSSTSDAFYYSGTGQVGDQRFEAPTVENGRVRDHEAKRDHLRLLRYVAKNQVKYIGQFRVDPDDPWRWRDGPDRYGTERKIIEFRLVPVGLVLRDPEDPVRDEPVAAVSETSVPPVPTEVPVEHLSSAVFEQVVAAQRRIARRRELELVHAFVGWLAAREVVACSQRIPYSPERRDLRTDLFLSGARTLFEAKASASRESIRAAIGQLLDYARWIEPRPRLCALLPTEAPSDMVTLLESLSIGVAWAGGSGFVVRPESLLRPKGLDGRSGAPGVA
jgi:hypothetical protein